jgi:hypothetical protein
VIVKNWYEFQLVEECFSVLVNFIAYSDILFANQRLVVKLCHADFLVEIRVIPATRISSDLAII